MSSKQHATTGVVIILEGNDGTGKTTICQSLVSELGTHFDNDCIYIREPGSDEITNKIRDLILYNEIDPTAELLLFNAARRINLTKYVLPELANGRIVIMDRFVDSTYVYQGMKNSVDDINAISNIIIPKEFNDYPCLKVLIHCDTQTIINRLKNQDREHNKYDDPDRIRLNTISDNYIHRFISLITNGENANIITGDKERNVVLKEVLDLAVNFIGEYC